MILIEAIHLNFSKTGDYGLVKNYCVYIYVSVFVEWNF